MAKKSKSKFKVNDVFLHKEEDKMFIVTEVFKPHNTKKNLYTLKEVNTDKDNTEYKRYYQDKLNDKCVKVKNDKAVKVLYGKKK